MRSIQPPTAFSQATKKTDAASILDKEEKRAKRDALEKQMLVQIMGTPAIPNPQTQYLFHPERKWRFDFAWPQEKIALEVQGGVHTGGGHVRGKGYNNDCEKNNEACVMGWRVLAVTTDHIASGQAVSWLTRIFTEPVEILHRYDSEGK